ncbi:MAG TPA: hypothetical protein VFW27_20170 [Actinoplanes sp.]|nr:hypothetical protein [Actinoplanes sp.]
MFACIDALVTSSLTTSAALPTRLGSSHRRHASVTTSRARRAAPAIGSRSLVIDGTATIAAARPAATLSKSSLGSSAPAPSRFLISVVGAQIRTDTPGHCSASIMMLANRATVSVSFTAKADTSISTAA